MTDSSLLADLDARGLIHDSTDREALAAALAAGPLAAYYGIDPTGASLHVGNLIGLLVLRRLQDAGHRPIALVGGATGMVGDPSGRSDERNLLDDETLAAGTDIYRQLQAAGVDVLLDDRDSRAGVKFADAELIGFPLRITVGPRGLANNELEVTTRATGETVNMGIAETIEWTIGAVAAAKVLGAE